MTKKILIDEAVVRQALDALEKGRNYARLLMMNQKPFDLAIAALREALEVNNKGVNALTEQPDYSICPACGGLAVDPIVPVEARQRESVACRDEMCACRGGPCASCPDGEREKELSDLRASLDFYKRRADELQKAQSKMRDPERTMVCDILANGTLLVPAGGRYSTPTQQAAEPVAWLFQNEETGLTQCVDTQQVEWGFEKNNPRWQKIAPLYTHPASTQQPLTLEAKAVIDAARAAMNDSFEAGNDEMDISIPAHLASTLSLRLDEYDGITGSKT